MSQQEMVAMSHPRHGPQTSSSRMPRRLLHSHGALEQAREASSGLQETPSLRIPMQAQRMEHREANEIRSQEVHRVQGLAYSSRIFSHLLRSSRDHRVQRVQLFFSL